MFLSRHGTVSLSRNLSRRIHGSSISSTHKLYQSWAQGTHKNPAKAFRSLSSTANVEGLKDSYENILVEVPEEGKGKVAVVKLHRPKALNALNDALFADLIHATRVLDADDQIRCVVLTGSTPKAFAAGADISEMSTRTFEEVYGRDMFAEWQEIAKLGGTPIIAAVSGYCLGGGNELAMMCDIMVCATNAKFGQPEINLGVIPGAGGTQRLTRAVGKSRAMQLCLTGDLMTADEALDAGLVAGVYDPDDLMPEALAMAGKIASKGAASLRACKEAINAAEELPLAEGLRLERRLFHALFATDDQKEGMAAFLEKRPAEFK